MCLVDPVSNRGDIRKSIGAHKIDGSRMLWGAMECRSLFKASDCREQCTRHRPLLLCDLR